MPDTYGLDAVKNTSSVESILMTSLEHPTAPKLDSPTSVGYVQSDFPTAKNSFLEYTRAKGNSNITSKTRFMLGINGYAGINISSEAQEAINLLLQKQAIK